MKVLITGGTGTLGSELVRAVTGTGHTVRIVSRRSRPENINDNIEFAQADLSTGEGVTEAVSGVSTIIHAATSPYSGALEVDVEGTRRLMAASEPNGVEHFIYPSIVGIEDIHFNYYRHKLEAEHIIQEGAVPYSILRGTQFHSLIDQFITALLRVPFVSPFPTDFQVQSVAARDMAGRLSRLLEEGPGGRLPNFGGPEVQQLREMARVWMAVRQQQKRVVRLPLPGQMASAFREGKNTDPNRKQGRTTWQEWLTESVERGNG
ncbi:MAG TPA: NAD(P)-dependent oxidoreductase [bacterium]|nr:NAD(P)-dependent oxidoreductase [bacterium]